MGENRIDWRRVSTQDLVPGLRGDQSGSVIMAKSQGLCSRAT